MFFSGNLFCRIQSLIGEAAGGLLIHSSPATPSPPAPPTLLPRPHPGAGAVRGDIQWEAVPGSSLESPPCSGPWGYRHGERGPGRGFAPAGGTPLRPHRVGTGAAVAIPGGMSRARAGLRMRPSGTGRERFRQSLMHPLRG